MAAAAAAVAAQKVPRRESRERHTNAVGQIAGGWNDLDYRNLTNAIRDIIAAVSVDCTLAVHSGVESTTIRSTIEYNAAAAASRAHEGEGGVSGQTVLFSNIFV